MFDISFTELVIIGIVALIVIGPERLPKVARTAGHLFGRMQRYVSTVKSDISREMQNDDLLKAGQSFKESMQSAMSEVGQQATAVDDYLRNEAGNVGKVVAAMASTEGERPVTEPALKQMAVEQASPQHHLALDEPDQNPGELMPADTAPTSEPASGKPA